MAYGLGSLTGLWSVGWIVFWGLVIYNTMVTAAFAALRAGDGRRSRCPGAVLVPAGVRGAVGGPGRVRIPWAVVAPILIGLGMSDLAVLRTAALGNLPPCPTERWAH
jgi:lactate permease